MHPGICVYIDRMMGIRGLVCAFAGLFIVMLVPAPRRAHAQSVQVPLETATGWGPVQPPSGYKGLRVQGRTSAPLHVVAQLFGDFAAHPSMFPRVVDDVQILACDATSLRARYRTMFDPKPGGKTRVTSLSNVKVTSSADRVEFTWSSNDVESNYVNAAWGRALFITERGPNGAETLIDYVSAVRPKNSAKGVLVETQKGVLAGDARYVINRLIALAAEKTDSGVSATGFSCK
jgi:hypothetical protein